MKHEAPNTDHAHSWLPTVNTLYACTCGALGQRKGGAVVALGEWATRKARREMPPTCGRSAAISTEGATVAEHLRYHGDHRAF